MGVCPSVGEEGGCSLPASRQASERHPIRASSGRRRRSGRRFELCQRGSQLLRLCVLVRIPEINTADLLWSRWSPELPTLQSQPLTTQLLTKAWPAVSFIRGERPQRSLSSLPASPLCVIMCLLLCCHVKCQWFSLCSL